MAIKKFLTRLAPSPTGFMHLGNAWSFLLAWLLARSRNGGIILRMDDIDPARSKKIYKDALIEDLNWLGLDWDDIIFQSQRINLYEEALKKLEGYGLVFKCFCSRKDLRMLANAPHPGDEGAPYSGFCRNLAPEQISENIAARKAWNTRFKFSGCETSFKDLIQDDIKLNADEIGGDFALKRSDGVISYQLACAVDDGVEKITHVCRGRDLISSAARQIAICTALDLAAPSFAHHALMEDARGERLAKRHADLSIRKLREKGVSAHEITGILGQLAGCNRYGEPKSPEQLLDNFDIAAVPKLGVRMPTNLDWA